MSKTIHTTPGTPIHVHVHPKGSAKGAPKGAIKKSGEFEGKSNALGHGGRAAQLKAKGVPGGVIGKLRTRSARCAGAIQLSWAPCGATGNAGAGSRKDQRSKVI